MPPSRYFVTGGDGFIGAHLVRRLVSRGDTTVITKPGSGLSTLRDVRASIQFRSVDVRDEREIHEAIRECRPTIIFHLAAAGMIPGQDTDEDIMMVNVRGAYNILSGIARTTTVERAVFVGSWYEYGAVLAGGSPRVPQPTSVYGISKFTATLLIQTFALAMDLSAIVVRPFQVYGPSEYPHRLIPQIVRSARTRAPLRLQNPGSLRDWIYVEDVAAALDLAGASDCRGVVADIGTGVTTSVADVANMVFGLLGLQRLRGEESLSDWKRRRSSAGDSSLSGAADIHLAQTLFGWKAEHGLTEGLRKTVEWYRHEGRA